MPASAPRLPRLLTLADTAQSLQVSTKTVRRMIERRELSAIRIGRQIRIAEDDIVALLARQRG